MIDTKSTIATKEQGCLSPREFAESVLNFLTSETLDRRAWDEMEAETRLFLKGLA